MSEVEYDVIVVGRGPVGLSMAMSAAQLGMKVAIIERHRDLYSLPRAGHLDHEIVRLLQSFDVADAMLADSYPTTDYTWVNAKGETLLEFDWGEKSVSGYNSDYMQFQPVFENALVEKLDEAKNVTQFLGWEASAPVQDDSSVTLTLAKTEIVDGQPVATDETVNIVGNYLVACDGAGSRIRESLGIELDDLGFNEDWLVIDARKKRELEFAFDCGQICDPKRPTTILPLGKRHRRFEWAVLPGEDPASLMTDKVAWQLLGEQGLGPDDLHIVRQLIYTFEARIAKQWKKGRIFLAGDAGHTTPPFMGQGMCSGMRDARNLSWKFDLVLRNIADPAILDSYYIEREPHTRDWTMISIEAGKIPCTTDPEEAEIRDQKFRDGWLPPMPDFPQLRDGILAVQDGSLTSLAGTLSLQARVEKDGKVALADDFFGSTGFSLLTVGFDAHDHLDAKATETFEKLGGQLISIGDHVGANATDADGTYADFFKKHDIAAMLVRPDFYIFGTTNNLNDITTLVGQLGKQLGMTLTN